MKNFCTDIQEIAKMRGLTKGEPCRSGNLTKIFSTVSELNYNNLDRHYDRFERIINKTIEAAFEYEGDIEVNITIR